MPNYGSKEQLYKDTLTNWIETGCGLWATPVERAERDADLNVLSVKVKDIEDEDAPIHTVTLDTIQTGFARVREREVKSLHGDYAAHIEHAWRENDGGMIDANDSDIVVQAGLFNECIYG